MNTCGRTGRRIDNLINCFGRFIVEFSPSNLQPEDIGFPKGNGKKLSCSQAQLGQATGFAVVCFPSISCGPSYVRRLYPRIRPDARFLFPSSNANSEHRYVHFAKRFYGSLSPSVGSRRQIICSCSQSKSAACRSVCRSLRFIVSVLIC